MGFFDLLFGKRERKELYSISAEEKMAINTSGDYEVILQSRGAAALQVCKIIYDYITVGDLKAAKALVDNAPSVIRSGVSLQGAEVIRKELEKAGATVAIRRQ